jgi:hypothetical protein
MCQLDVPWRLQLLWPQRPSALTRRTAASQRVMPSHEMLARPAIWSSLRSTRQEFSKSDLRSAILPTRVGHVRQFGGESPLCNLMEVKH